MTSRIAVSLVGLVALVTGTHARAQQAPLTDPIPQPIPPSQIRVALEPVVGGLRSPIDMAIVDRRNDRRKFIVDQTGLVLVLRGDAIQPTPFLDITGVISQISPAFGTGPLGLNPGYDERGLLGLAFHPGFSDRRHPGFGRLYTLHNVPVARPADFPQPPFPAGGATPNCQEVIAEWQVDRSDPDVVDPSSYRELLRYDKPQFNHNGGTVAFGPDGLLYAAFGDGGAANDAGAGHIPDTGNAQSLTTILGKVIRIDPLPPALTSRHEGAVSRTLQYRIPNDNPFVKVPGAVDEIWAFGFRNPYRFSFDADNGRLVLADVGQNNIEEVDIVRKGNNYGWNHKEGTFLFSGGSVFNDPSPDPDLTNPVAQYDHFEATAGKITRVAIVGGFVYRGSAISALKKKYVCADVNGFLFAVNLDSGRIEQLLDTGMFIKGFGQDDRNELYVLASTIEGPGAPGSTNGGVFKITSVGRGHGDDDDDGHGHHHGD